ncbi:Ig-like domain-containing protein, partial [Variovorax robiniae]
MAITTSITYYSDSSLTRVVTPTTVHAGDVLYVKVVYTTTETWWTSAGTSVQANEFTLDGFTLANLVNTFNPANTVDTVTFKLTATESSGTSSFSINSGALSETNRFLNSPAVSSPAFTARPIDTVLPPVTIDAKVGLGGDTVVSSQAGDNIISGTAEIGSGYVTITEGSAVLGTALVNASGQWTFTLTGLAQGSHTLTASQTDLHSNTGMANIAISVDTLAPTVAITSNVAAVKAGQTALITFSFSEAPTGFTTSDIAVSGGAVTGLAVTADPKVYTATFTPTADLASGSASITVGASTYTDAAGNNGGAGTTPTIAIDTRAPTVAITSNVAAVKAGQTALITFTFSEAPTGFTTSDIAVSGGAVTGLAVTADPKVYTATFTPTADLASGSASITVGASTYTDAAGNNGGAGTTPTIAIDTLAPTVAITSNVAAVKAGQTALITFTFSEAPTGFTTSDIAVSGGA